MSFIYLNKEIFRYVIVGVGTTLINFTTHYFCRSVLLLDVQTSIIIAWFLSVVFAYLFNKVYVFESKTNNLKTLGKEIGLFFSSRGLSLVLEIVMMSILIDSLSWNEGVSKLITQLFILVANFVFSKWLFSLKKEKQ